MATKSQMRVIRDLEGRGEAKLLQYSKRQLQDFCVKLGLAKSGKKRDLAHSINAEKIRIKRKNQHVPHASKSDLKSPSPKYIHQEIRYTSSMRYANGDKYEGEFVDNRRDGIGTVFYANGDKYEGEWKNDEIVEGKGTKTIVTHAKIIPHGANHSAPYNWTHKTIINPPSHPDNTTLENDTELIWAANFHVNYNSTPFIPCKNHEILRMRVLQEEREWGITNKETKKRMENFVSAQLAFVYTETNVKNEKRNGNHFHEINIAREDGIKMHVLTEYEESEEFKEDLKRYHPEDSATIEMAYADKIQKKNPSYHMDFHHSERAIFKHLENISNIKRYVNELALHINGELHESHEKFEVQVVILDMHSSRYLCDWCEKGLKYFLRKSSPFFQLLKGTLADYGFRVSQDLYLFSRYSAERPCGKTKPKTLKEHKFHYQPILITKYVEKGTSLILQRDDNQTIQMPVNNLATSRKDNKKRNGVHFENENKYEPKLKK